MSVKAQYYGDDLGKGYYQVDLDEDAASQYGLAAGVYSPAQLHNAGQSYSQFLQMTPEEQSIMGAGGTTFNNGVADNTKFDANAALGQANSLAGGTAGTGLFGLGTDKDWSQYGKLGTDVLSLGLAYGSYQDQKKNNEAMRKSLAQQYVFNEEAAQNKRNIQKAFSA